MTKGAFKKITVVVIVFLLAGAPLSYGQPVFTRSDYGPLAGETIEYDICWPANPGNSGIGQVWNFSNTNDGGDNEKRVDSASTLPCSADYPNANYGIGPHGTMQPYLLCHVSDSIYECFGHAAYPNLITDFQYSDPELIFRFPMFFQDSISDQFEGVSNLVWPSLYRFGTCYTVYDGTGTLITPNDTFYNVIRMHHRLYWVDSSQFYSDTVGIDEYLWYALGYHLAVAKCYVVSDNNVLDTNMILFRTLTTNCYESSLFRDVLIFPSPADDHVYITCDAFDERWQLSIYNLMGEQVLLKEGLKPESIIITSELAAGLYTFVFLDRTGESVIQKVVIAH